jgi:GH3 auxin-responsive promoter
MALLKFLLNRYRNLANIYQKLRSINIKRSQRITLKKLLKKGKNTKFGIFYKFKVILFFRDSSSKQLIYEYFKKTVPIHDYNKIHSEWWHRSYAGEKNVCWPGAVKFFALSSGTSEATSKAIPVTKAMLKAIHKTSIHQILSLFYRFKLPLETFEKGFLFLGGCTTLNPVNKHLEGDLSGITVGKMPKWFERFYLPGLAISQTKNWDLKLEEIAQKAIEWDIAFVAGVPAWVQMLFERIIEKYNVETIHDIWPNLLAYGWGGVSLEPYKEGFNKLLDKNKPFHYIETYLASEGFLAYQASPNSDLRLVLNKGIFFEFIPFTAENFDADGKVKSDAKAYMIHEVELHQEYALLISTCAGAWRYLIGDTLKFTNISKGEIKITGRTKHFLSLCGEHLSVDNMNKAVADISVVLSLIIKEFTVIGEKTAAGFTHTWYIGCDQEVNEDVFSLKMDAKLKSLNDDYALERQHALQEVKFNILPTEIFLDWMKSHGKQGGQTKFPRVLKGDLAEDWKRFLLANRSSVLLAEF